MILQPMRRGIYQTKSNKTSNNEIKHIFVNMNDSNFYLLAANDRTVTKLLEAGTDCSNVEGGIYQ